MDTTITTTKLDARDALIAEFPEAPAEVLAAIDDLVAEINARQGAVRIYSDYLGIWVEAA